MSLTSQDLAMEGEQGRAGRLLGANSRALMLFSFQGYPGPKGEMVRPQLSCFLKGWGISPALPGQRAPGTGK